MADKPLSPAEAGRRLAEEHNRTHPLTEQQIEAAAAILASVQRTEGSATSAA